MTKTMFSSWLAEKFTSFLKTEGFEVHRNLSEGNSSIIQTTDAFGNIYQVKVTLMGRIDTDSNKIALRREYSIF